jgi:hypothetical protein
VPVIVATHVVALVRMEGGFHEVTRWVRSLGGAAAAALVLVGASPTGGGTGAVTAPNLVLRLSLPGGDVVRTATVTSRETGAVVRPAAVTANTCYLDGRLPSLVATS